MMLDLGCRRGHTQRVESGALEDVVQDAEVHRCILQHEQSCETQS
jgi:hypothetical protein